MKGIDYLRSKLDLYRKGALYRQKIYDMKNHDVSPGITIPNNLRQQYKATLGWGAKAVDSLADRLVFREFANDNFGINEIFQMNSADILFDDAKLSSLINSCSFIYISEGDDDIPRLQVIQGSEATGILDPVTRLLTEGYAVLSRDEYGKPKEELYFVTGRTDHFVNGDLYRSVDNNAPAPLLVPIIHRPDSSKPFGRSRITPSAIYYQKYAKRTLERADITAEFYSWPQKYVVGTSQDSEAMDNWKATISSFLEFTKDDAGDKPTLGQFTVPSMSPFVEQLRTAASGFAGETGLTLDDLGFPSDNPSSAEAIKASHETLRLAAEKAQRDFSSGFLNVGYLAASLRDNHPYSRSQLYQTKAKWEPVFKPDASTISLIGDGAVKINQAIPGYFGNGNLRDLTGIDGENDGN
ncbi:hypothetical protein [Ornithinibacillus sp. JPR2-1]|uniref:hypothetical protein n=1 Tax=Ornithinibacillus sp. JPR2-1 TaxID=2094019 RepID=UPI0031D5DEBB